ncbi:DUF4382 domain-containing protein [Flaviaesturariibacter terrae]
MNKTALTTLAVASLGTLLFACSKTENSAAAGSGRLEVFLTDAPGNYDSVVIDVQDVRVNYGSDSANGWQSLANVTRGPINLLQLVNDRDTMLGSADLASGRIEQLRLLLGPNNYVVVGGRRYDLETPSAQQSGLKLNIHQDVTEGVTYRLVLDFDAGRSIHQTGNGRYMLKPVIRTSLEAAGGSLRGYVLPSTVRTAIYALQGADTVAGTYTSNGAWSFQGLNAGSYNLSFVPSDSTYSAATRTGVAVTTGNVTVVDTVRLQ